jgi:hypothetical protein
MVAQLCEYTKSTAFFFALNGWIIWYMNYSSIKLLPKIIWLYNPWWCITQQIKCAVLKDPSTTTIACVWSGYLHLLPALRAQTIPFTPISQLPGCWEQSANGIDSSKPRSTVLRELRRNHLWRGGIATTEMEAGKFWVEQAKSSLRTRTGDWRVR